MSRVTRDDFVDSRFSLSLDNLTAEEEASLRRSGIGRPALDRIAGQDGVIEGRAELDELFALVDGLDRDGSRRSLATTRRNTRGDESLTGSGAALAALRFEVEEARLAQRLARPESSIDRDGTRGARPNDPEWLKTAYAEIDVAETKGRGATARILEYFDATYQRRGTDAEHTDDTGKANAWCAAFMTWALTESGVKNGKAVGAREYEKWGEASEPFRGAVVVLQKGRQKHVALLAGVERDGTNVYLGGNQDNKVSASVLPGYSVVAIRKPTGYVIPEALKVLPQVNGRVAAETR